MKCAILAPGQSMSQAVADSVRDYPLVIAVSNVAVDTKDEAGNVFPAIAPWAHALVAQDRQWWRQYRQAHEFGGRKFSTNAIDGVEQVRSDGFLSTQSSSGCVALMVADIVFHATDIELYGFDMRGSHYFGPHTGNLRNTSATRFEEFQNQFAAIGVHFKNRGIRVINRTPGSALRCFPFE